MSHAQERALERYGLELTAEDFRRIRRDIAEGRAIKQFKAGNKKSVYLCEVQGVTVRLVYNRRRKFVITVLPLEPLGE